MELIEKSLSVRELAERATRSGSIDSRYAASVRAAEGTRLHKILQKNDDGEYETEVTLRAEYERGGVLFKISGRADGIIHTSDGVIVDEIKTTRRQVSEISADDYPAHLAQAACYARMYCEREGLGAIGVRLTYCQTDTGEICRHAWEFSLPELEVYINALLDKLVFRAVSERNWIETSRAAMRALEFPYGEFRPGQRRLAAEIYRLSRDGGTLFACAPTGTGKTISALFPSVKALGDSLCDKVFYLTAKETARSVATDAVRKMQEQGLRARAVVITAKDKICPLPERRCDPEFCKYAQGHFDRVDAAVEDAVSESDFYGRDEVQKVAERHCVCPFELSLDISSVSDIVICDYNYVFDPRIALKRFFAEGGNYILLADEAHNLPDRAREMYSCELYKSAFLSARRALPSDKNAPRAVKSLRSALGGVNKALLTIGREVVPESAQRGEHTDKNRPEALDKAIEKLITAAESYLSEVQIPPPEVLDAYWSALDYMRCAERWGENYAFITRAGYGEVNTRLYCADPAEYLAETLVKVRAAVFFSATLSPPEYYAKLLGGGEERRLLMLPSPFPVENFMPLIADFISTRYRDREHSLDSVAELIYTCWYMREGNYIAFFPSYAYMDDVFERFTALFPDAPALRQEKGMDTASRDEFLNRFEEGGSLVGFCVMGGVFAEGVDFTGERAIGVIIAGTGLPGIDAESEILREYCDNTYGAGYDFAYVYPGMNRVLQAAGRVIRSETDRGIALLIDDRFSRTPYPPLFPAHWSHRRRLKNVSQLREALGRFWNK